MKQAQALHDAGYKVDVVATRLAGKLDLSEEAKLPWTMHYVDLRPRYIWYPARTLQLAVDALPIRWMPDVLARVGANPFVLPLAIATARVRADLYLAHYPASLPASALAARIHGGVYAFDAEDFHQGEVPDGDDFEPHRRRTRALEEPYLRTCSFVTAASPMIAQAVSRSYQDVSPIVTLNAFPRHQAPRSATPAGVARPGPSVYWFSQTVGPNRGLETALKAVAMARTRPHIYLRGLCTREYRAELLRLAVAQGCADRLHFLDPAEPEAMEALAADYDLGLCSEPGHVPNNGMALSNKLFTFLVAGVPPLLSDTPAQAEFAREAGLSSLVYPRADATALAARIDECLKDPQRLASMRQQVWGLGQQRYNWDIERCKFLALVEAACPA